MILLTNTITEIIFQISFYKRHKYRLQFSTIEMILRSGADRRWWTMARARPFCGAMRYTATVGNFQFNAIIFITSNAGELETFDIVLRKGFSDSVLDFSHVRVIFGCGNTVLVASAILRKCWQQRSRAHKYQKNHHHLMNHDQLISVRKIERSIGTWQKLNKIFWKIDVDR